MDPFALESPLLDSGIRSVNFFNGRLLTANDLRREQDARRINDRWLGQAMGDGVAWGLEVHKHPESTAQNPLVTVEAGLAVNRDGQPLALKSQATLALVRKSKAAAAAGVTFAQCGTLQTGTYVAGPGIYLLTIAPASSKEGKALTSGFDQYGGKCNTDAIVDTVQFRLISLESQLSDLDIASEDRLRNQAAYRCLGTDRELAVAASPLGAGPAPTLVEALRGAQLTECDVPVAILYWTLSGGVRFVDNWSVRRRLSGRARPQGWASQLTDEQETIGEARLLQFREHLQTWLSAGRDLSSFQAREHLSYLPPVGLLPMGGNAGQSGTTIDAFFDGMTVSEPRFMEGARLQWLLRMGMAYPPIDCASSVLVRVYLIRENFQALSKPLAQRPQAVLVFASGHIPPIAQARFDVSQWDFSNYV